MIEVLQMQGIATRHSHSMARSDNAAVEALRSLEIIIYGEAEYIITSKKLPRAKRLGVA